jgi:peptidoglycan/xylan/chitin deacetylase (PgdA/CDA1 family)
MILITTSWDDGDIHDLKIAEMLCSRGLKGTFYVPVRDSFVRPLSPANLRDLSSSGFEIGAHTLTHQVLTTLLDKDMADEVEICKYKLEQWVGFEVPMFCYPNGRFNDVVLSHVKKAGYKGARTTRMLSTDLSFSPYRMPTTLQAFPHRLVAYGKSVTAARSCHLAYSRLQTLLRSRNWVELGRKLFDHVYANGGMWHLYGHSWEIESRFLWPELAELLDYVSGIPDAMYVSNSELLAITSERSHNEALDT